MDRLPKIDLEVDQHGIFPSRYLTQVDLRPRAWLSRLDLFARSTYAIGIKAIIKKIDHALRWKEKIETAQYRPQSDRNSHVVGKSVMHFFCLILHVDDPLNFSGLKDITSMLPRARKRSVG